MSKIEEALKDFETNNKIHSITELEIGDMISHIKKDSVDHFKYLGPHPLKNEDNYYTKHLIVKTANPGRILVVDQVEILRCLKTPDELSVMLMMKLWYKTHLVEVDAFLDQELIAHMENMEKVKNLKEKDSIEEN